jgi:hypothetical protein
MARTPTRDIGAIDFSEIIGSQWVDINETIPDLIWPNSGPHVRADAPRPPASPRSSRATASPSAARPGGSTPPDAATKSSRWSPMTSVSPSSAPTPPPAPPAGVV